MNKSKLIEYVQSQLEMGTSKGELQKILIDEGWGKDVAEEAFSLVDKKIKSKNTALRIFFRSVWAFVVVAVLGFIVVSFVIAILFVSSMYSRVEEGEGDEFDNSLAILTNSLFVQSALEEYWIDKREYPASLDLVSGYINEVPNNPITKEPFVYRAENNGADYNLCAEMNGENECADSRTSITGKELGFPEHN